MAKSTLVKIHWFFSTQLGLDPLRLYSSVKGLRFFLSDYRKFRKSYKGKLEFKPSLNDRFEEGGDTKSEYFWQDLTVARWIFEKNPKIHVDIGSRVDGFVAHVASFREIEVLDVRRMTTRIPGIVFRQADLMQKEGLPTGIDGGYCDSLSCLHTIEHFGLGRYGDPINPDGYIRGIENMALLLKPEGTFYLSTPIGKQKVEFNANWIFDPRTIINLVEAQGLVLHKMVVFGSGGMHEIQVNGESLNSLANADYNLGIFIFNKQSI